MKKGLTEMRGVPEMLTAREVCEKLKMSKRTLYRRQFRFVPDGGRRLYFADDIRMYLTLNTTSPE